MSLTLYVNSLRSGVVGHATLNDDGTITFDAKNVAESFFESWAAVRGGDRAQAFRDWEGNGNGYYYIGRGPLPRSSKAAGQ